MTGGSGSAEATGKSRDEQKNRDFTLDNDAKKDIANDAEIPENNVVGLKDLGAGSGRDDYAGGSGDSMSSANTNEPTDLS